VGMEESWNDPERGKEKYSEENHSMFHVTGNEI